MTCYDRTYPFAWLGILAEAAPASEELIYTYHERGFALFSMRSPSVTRLYLQCTPDEDLANWPDDRIWAELMTRFRTRDGWTPAQGAILQKGVAEMRGFVVEPMQHGRLFLAGDAAHIVPPTGAKGLNLAVADVRILARALADFFQWPARAIGPLLGDLSRPRLEGPAIFLVDDFDAASFSRRHAFDQRRQLAELDYLTTSRAAMTLAENYVGLPLD